jgi:hypothetical protein
MEPKSYAMLLAEYGNRFGELPPSILSEEGQSELMARATARQADQSVRPRERV